MKYINDKPNNTILELTKEYTENPSPIKLNYEKDTFMYKPEKNILNLKIINDG